MVPVHYTPPTRFQQPPHLVFGLATGRHIGNVKRLLKKTKIPKPDLIIAAVGSEIYYGHNFYYDQKWDAHINFRWHPEAIRKTLSELPGLRLQPAANQSQFKISYLTAPGCDCTAETIRSLLRQMDLQATVVFSHNRFMDVLPVRASKGDAIRHISMLWGIDIRNILVAGDSGNDIEMLRGESQGIVVGNYDSELDILQGHSHIYFSSHKYAWGILDGMRHYKFPPCQSFVTRMNNQQES